MTIGTAGFTAALSVLSLEERGLDARRRSGARDGRDRWRRLDRRRDPRRPRLRGRRQHRQAGGGEPYLRGLGAADVIDRAELSGEGGKPLESMVWAAAVDCVGGRTLANVLARIRYGGAVAASGLTGGAGLETTVLPFILRNVALLGIDSVQTAIDRRRAVWELLGGEMKPSGLDVRRPRRHARRPRATRSTRSSPAGRPGGWSSTSAPGDRALARVRRVAGMRRPLSPSPARAASAPSYRGLDDDRSRRQELDVGARARVPGMRLRRVVGRARTGRGDDPCP